MKPDVFFICKVVLLSIMDKKVKNYIYLKRNWTLIYNGMRMRLLFICI